MEQQLLQLAIGIDIIFWQPVQSFESQEICLYPSLRSCVYTYLYVYDCVYARLYMQVCLC